MAKKSISLMTSSIDNNFDTKIVCCYRDNASNADDVTNRGCDHPPRCQYVVGLA